MSECGPWIEHDGKGCPLPVGTPCECIFEAFPGVIVADPAPWTPCSGGVSWDWKFWLTLDADSRLIIARIVRYRTRRPQALLDLIRIAENPRELEDVH